MNWRLKSFQSIFIALATRQSIFHSLSATPINRKNIDRERQNRDTAPLRPPHWPMRRPVSLEKNVDHPRTVSGKRIEPFSEGEEMEGGGIPTLS